MDGAIGDGEGSGKRSHRQARSEGGLVSDWFLIGGCVYYWRFQEAGIHIVLNWFEELKRLVPVK